MRPHHHPRAAITRNKGRRLKTVILHLGTHKAASTSVQMFLAHNRERLRALGLCYPETPPPTPFAHHGLAWHFINTYTGNTRRPGNYPPDRALADFAASGCDTLMLSSEDFLACTPYEGFLDAFFAQLREVFERVVVCAFVRDRKGFFTSSYNMWIKSLVYSGDFARYLREAVAGDQAPMHYTRSLARWAAGADEAVYLPFLPGSLTRPVEQELLVALGLPPDKVAGLEPYADDALNASIGPTSLLAHRCMAALLGEAHWYAPYDLPRREMLTRFLEEQGQQRGWHRERCNLFTATAMETVLERFSAEDEAFAVEFFGRPWAGVFDGENALEPVNERHYAELDPGERRVIDEVVTDGLARARSLYDVPYNATEKARERRFRLSRGRCVAW